MRFKSEVFNIFMKFKAMVELQSEHQIKKIRNVGEVNIPQRNSMLFVKIWA